MLEKKLRQIPKEHLVKGKWFLGRGRNSDVGYWDGKNFLVIGFKFNEPVIKQEGYYEKDFGCFQPFWLIPEGEIIEPFGKVGWNRHYGKTFLLKFE
ncbi:hypothetical protein J4433_02715 [Candidatus Pacearchaeota archaeon]|nr:hypothetical protein [Candidatus Pacearchaeota archaeon]